jgi:hypothetical protein
MDEPVRVPRARLRQLNWRPCLAPAGGAIAAVCFFLPWGRFSFLLVHRSASGFAVGGWAWVIFALAAMVTVAGVVLPRRRRPEPARAVVFSAALLGLLCFVFEANELARGVWTPFGRIQPQDIGVKPGLGARGTAVGFLLALAGAFLMPGPRPRWLPTWPALNRRKTPIGSPPVAGRPVGGAPAAGVSNERAPAAGPLPTVDLRGSSGAGGEGME